jgi:F-type H+-transporting ATPase subunit delta
VRLQALSFAILIFFTMKFIWPPLMNAIEERQKRIADGLAAADRSQRELAQAEERVNDALRDARVKANEIIVQAEQRASQIIDQAKTDAVAEAERQKAAAQAEIASAANRAREELRKQLSQLAVAGAEKLIKREIDGNATRRCSTTSPRSSEPGPDPMSHALTLARPYARAAFSLAREHGRLPQWTTLLGFTAAMAADARVQALLGHPRLGLDDQLGLLLPDADVDPTFRQFLAVLSDNRRLALLPEIAAQYEALRAEAERVVKVTVTSAAPMGAAEVGTLTAALKRRFGSEIALSQAVDPDLIGGAVIDAGDVVIDGSLRGKLARLQAELAN